jgi:hypothetical protein
MTKQIFAFFFCFIRELNLYSLHFRANSNPTPPPYSRAWVTRNKTKGFVKTKALKGGGIGFEFARKMREKVSDQATPFGTPGHCQQRRDDCQ